MDELTFLGQMGKHQLQRNVSQRLTLRVLSDEDLSHSSGRKSTEEEVLPGNQRLR